MAPSDISIRSVLSEKEKVKPPNKYRGLAIGVIGFVNSFASWIVQQVFPWELSNFGNALSFFIFGAIAVVGFFILFKILPETKGKSLEQIEKELVKS